MNTIELKNEDKGQQPQGMIGLCPNHSVCQKLKAENEIFLTTSRERFTKTVSLYKLPEDVKDQLLAIIEMILTEEKPLTVIDPTVGIAGTAGFTGIPAYCNEIRLENEFHKIQFFKVCYFLECLEKSKLSAIHLHRISIFLQTGIFKTLGIREFFEQMTSVDSLYECKMCRLIIPVDVGLEEICNHFYLSVRTRCKECFKRENKDRYMMKKTKKEIEESSKPMTKMYLCMKCGEDNYINFYERNKSKCKFCILAEKRGMIIGSDVVAASASKSHHCKECHTEDPKNFRETYKSLCYACFLEKKKEKYNVKKAINNAGFDEEDQDDKDESPKEQTKQSSKPYFCKDCETDIPGKFRRGYKSQCYECFLKEKNINRVAKKEAIVLTGEKEPAKILIDTIKDEKYNTMNRYVECKYCNDKNTKNFNEGMDTVCARCEEIEMESYICKGCNLECLRTCMNVEKGLCNLCDPETIKGNSRKPYKCSNCNETRPENFYSGFKSKCKLCVRDEKRKTYEVKAKSMFHCSECGTENEKDFYPGSKNKCKDCL
jgi:hypothetical protein